MIKQFFYILLLILLSCNLKGQELNSFIDSSAFYVGSPVQLEYRVTFEEPLDIKFFPIEKSILIQTVDTSAQENTTFELLEKCDFDTVKTTEGKISVTCKYKGTVWSPGTFIIPRQEILINDSIRFFDELTIMVELTPEIDSIPLYDIKESFERLPQKKFDFIAFIKTYYWIPLLLLLFSLLYFILKRKKRKIKISEENHLTPREKALSELDELLSLRLWEKGQEKEHFTRLSYILRDYLARHWKESLLEKTTTEIRNVLRDKNLSNYQQQDIINILTASDLVKFAKSQPTEKQILESVELTKEIIEKLDNNDK